MGDAHMLHWWQEICPQHIFHAAFALRVICRCLQKTPGVCRLVLVCEREDLCSATQLMGKDGDAKESSTAQEVHEQVAGHDVGEDGTRSLSLFEPLVLQESQVLLLERLLRLRTQPPLELQVQVAPFVPELARQSSAHGLLPLLQGSSI